MIPPADRLSNISTYYFAKKLAEIEKLNRSGGPFVINLGIGSPDLDPPSNVIDSIRQALNEPKVHMYQPYKGISSLRNAFADWYKRFFDVILDPDQNILPLMGSKEGVMHISMSYLNPGDHVLIPNPGYPSYSACAKIAGGVPVDMPLKLKNGWRPDIDDLSKRDLSKVKIMWLNYPHMPTGAVVDKGFLKEIISLCIDRNILLAYDNPYVFILNDNPFSILELEGAMSCAVELVSLSKCYNMAGWRVGALSGPQQAIDTILQFKSNMDSGMFKPVQLAAIEALNMGGEWISDLNKTYKDRQKIAHDIMTLLGLSFEYSGAGLFVWGRIPSKYTITSEKLSDTILEQTRVFITPGHIFGSEGEGYMRISLCSPIEDLMAAQYRIQTLFDKKIIH